MAYIWPIGFPNSIMKNYLRVSVHWPVLNARFAWGTAIIVGIAGTLFTCVDYQVQDQAVVRGQVLYVARCASCHSVDENRTGPMHRGVVGRQAGSVSNFDYSPALRNSHLVWTQANLLAWLKDPEAFIPGQGMDVHLDQTHDREDVVAYLASLKMPGH
jgi:cytochrome c